MNASHQARPPTSTVRRALAHWRIAEAFMHLLHNLFGAPADLAVRHTITAAAHKQIVSWLRCAEALMRRLLLIEAAAYPKPAAPKPRAKRPRARRFIEVWPDKPEGWRVSFRCAYGPPASRRPARGLQDKAQAGETRARQVKRFYSAWPLAERYEALIRVFNDPAPYARRLARRLYGAPRRVRALLRAPPDFRHRVDNAEAITHAAETEAAVFDTS